MESIQSFIKVPTKDDVLSFHNEYVISAATTALKKSEKLVVLPEPSPPALIKYAMYELIYVDELSDQIKGIYILKALPA